MWQKDPPDTNGDGKAGDATDLVSWCNAIAYCEKLELGAHDDWRLPSIRELESILDHGRSFPAVDPVLGALTWSAYWSSTSSYVPEMAWGVTFAGGSIGISTKGDGNLARAVRGGL